ncbi:MAG: hypothetical protein ACFE7R_05430, partial [Candidatus Hodarchaeota archaeon]
MLLNADQYIQYGHTFKKRHFVGLAPRLVINAWVKAKYFGMHSLSPFDIMRFLVNSWPIVPQVDSNLNIAG